MNAVIDIGIMSAFWSARLCTPSRNSIVQIEFRSTDWHSRYLLPVCWFRGAQIPTPHTLQTFWHLFVTFSKRAIILWITKLNRCMYPDAFNIIRVHPSIYVYFNMIIRILVFSVLRCFTYNPRCRLERVDYCSLSLSLSLSHIYKVKKIKLIYEFYSYSFLFTHSILQINFLLWKLPTFHNLLSTCTFRPIQYILGEYHVGLRND